MSKIYSGAIDCSFNFCGCAILCRTRKDSKPFIKTTRIIENPNLSSQAKKSLQDLDRCSILYDGVKRFVDDLMDLDKQKNDKTMHGFALDNIKILSFEVPGGSQSSRAAACLGMAKGVLGSVLSLANTRDYLPGSWMRNPVMPSKVHKRVSGNVKATKEEIMNYVLKKYPTNIYFDKKKYWVHQIHYDAPMTLDEYTKGQFEHIADAIVMAELGLEEV